MLRVLTADRLAPPGEILRRLNDAMETLAPEVTATCALARVEEAGPGRWRLNYAVAGYPPPLLMTAGGSCRRTTPAAEASTRRRTQAEDG
ncbi:SpoIIE family protein phosphatase [Actinomadura sp. NPDC048032]|uniref:SpoIIE family protein phosphatase n=1 Tax=Actinomadura sp. NPDC048032 TaxID=3155747 RepID=UPI0033D6F98C